MTSIKTAKRALIFSVLATFLCVAMLTGTTFAWFTDSATTGTNQIQAGNLDIVLEYATEWNEAGVPSKWADANGKTLPFLTVDGHEAKTYWEPGCTYQLPELRVRNNGTLPVRFEYIINGFDGDSKLLEVLRMADTILQDETGDLEAPLPAGGTSLYFALTFHMDEAAGNEYQGLTAAGIGITVVATQANEAATFPVVNAEELAEAFEKGGIVSINQEVPVAPAVDRNNTSLQPQTIIKKDTVLNLAGKLTVDPAAAAAGFGEASPAFAAVESGTLTINGNGELNCEAGTQQVYGINVNGGSVVINGGHFYGALTAVQVQKGSLEINGGFFDMAPTCKAQVPHYAKYVVNCIDASWKNGTATISIKGGTFVNFDPSANPEGEGTTYVAEGYKVVSAEQENGDTWYTVVAK